MRDKNLHKQNRRRKKDRKKYSHGESTRLVLKLSNVSSLSIIRYFDKIFYKTYANVVCVCVYQTPLFQ